MSRERGRSSLYVKAILILLGFITVAVVTLGLIGLKGFTDINEEHGLIRVDRAGRAAAEAATWSGFGMSCVTKSGSPTQIQVTDPTVLEPAAEWDGYVDRVSEMNQGAANVFTFNAASNSFDRISTSFRDESGARLGEGTVTPSVIAPGHPAHQSLVGGGPFVGEVPVKERLRLAYLTPVVDESGSTVGAIAVDVGWVDDLKRANSDAAYKVAGATAALLVIPLLAGAYFMTRAFRPLRALGDVAGSVGQGETVEHIPYQDRQNEIGNIAHGLAQVVDLQDELRTLAYVDELTGLPNRAKFTLELERRVAEATVMPETDGFVLLLLDLDQFKEVNDALGHAAGDRLLASVAARLQRIDLRGALCARIGGDEFAVLTDRPLTDAEASDTAGTISAAVVEAAKEGTSDFNVSCSIGIVRVPEQANTSEETLSHADLALYQAKRNGRAQHEFYREELSREAQRRVHLSADLRRALRAGDIRIDVQPQFRLAPDRLAGFEALARWDHQEEGAIAPSEFIEVAESAGLIGELGAQVLDLSLATARRLLDEGVSFESMSVNVSPIQLWQPTFFDSVMVGLQRHRIEPSRLCLEITENVLMESDDDRTWTGLRRLSALGVRLSIDDFGTGYCSLSYLDDLPFDQLKIDRSFVDGIDQNPARRELFTGILSLGRSLGLEVVVEGIERAEEMQIVAELGADLAQGYLLGRPGPASAAGAVRGSGVVTAARGESSVIVGRDSS